DLIELRASCIPANSQHLESYCYADNNGAACCANKHSTAAKFTNNDKAGASRRGSADHNRIWKARAESDSFGKRTNSCAVIFLTLSHTHARALLVSLFQNQEHG